MQPTFMMRSNIKVRLSEHKRKKKYFFLRLSNVSTFMAQSDIKVVQNFD